MASTSTGPTGSPKITFSEPFDDRRSTSSDASDGEGHYQDWTRTTAEKDSWANRERRRSSIFSKVDNYPAATYNSSIPHSTTNVMPSSPTLAKAPSPTSDRRGSILSLWTHGKDENGRGVLHSGDGNVEAWDGEVVVVEEEELKRTVSAESAGKKRRNSKVQPQERRGSILSMWSQAKDKDGNWVIDTDHV